MTDNDDQNTTTNAPEDDDWQVACSDEEMYGWNKETRSGQWQPSPSRIAFLYNEVEKNGGSLDLKWQCPGRRPPSSSSPSSNNDKKTSSVAEATKQSISTEFDFDEEFADSPASSTVRSTVPSLASRRKTGQSECRLLFGVTFLSMYLLASERDRMYLDPLFL